MKRTLPVLIAAFFVLVANSAAAQDSADEAKTDAPAESKATENAEGDDKTVEEETDAAKEDEHPEEPDVADLADGPTKLETTDEGSEPEFEAMPAIKPETLEELTLTKTYPYIEHHGLFRFRADAFYNLDLNTAGTTTILPPAAASVPEANNPVDRDADWLAGANIRFRYEPKIHIFEDLAIKLTVDAPQNYVMGSRPYRAITPLVAFTPGQEPLSGSDGVVLREAYGEARTFFGMIRAGRMASNWGLGMLANDGKCEDCDFGDIADRVQFATKAFDTYGFVYYDFPSEGPVAQPLAYEVQGVRRDADQSDDIEQWVLGVMRKPLTREEKADRVRTLKEDRKPYFSGGFYFVYRTQQNSFEDADEPDDYYSTTNNAALIAREAEAYIPDLWARLEWEPYAKSYLRLEVEAAAILGEIKYVKQPGSGAADCFGENATSSACEKLSREVKQFGLAFESEFRANQFFSMGFNGGYASGRRNFGFQVNDGRVDPEDAPSNFRFDRDYIVDMLLFRELIGAVTNAMYFNPWVQFDFFSRNKDSLGLKFGSIYARAVEAEATPSGEANLGLEFDTTLFYEEHNKYKADISYGLLVPMAAWDAVEGRTRYNYPGTSNNTFTADDAREAELAHTIQARMFWFY